jgi:hypothetical protein
MRLTSARCGLAVTNATWSKENQGKRKKQAKNKKT